MRLWPRQWGTARRRTGCAEVMRVLQGYLDGETDEVTARRVIEHLDDCRACGLEADLYLAIKESLARQERPDARAVERLRAFGESLLGPGQGSGSGPVPGE